MINGYWCPDDASIQGFSNPGIYYIEQEQFSLRTLRVMEDILTQVVCIPR